MDYRFVYPLGTTETEEGGVSNYLRNKVLLIRSPTKTNNISPGFRGWPFSLGSSRLFSRLLHPGGPRLHLHQVGPLGRGGAAGGGRGLGGRALGRGRLRAFRSIEALHVGRTPGGWTRSPSLLRRTQKPWTYPMRFFVSAAQKKIRTGPDVSTKNQWFPRASLCRMSSIHRRFRGRVSDGAKRGSQIRSRGKHRLNTQDCVKAAALRQNHEI